MTIDDEGVSIPWLSHWGSFFLSEYSKHNLEMKYLLVRHTVELGCQMVSSGPVVADEERGRETEKKSWSEDDSLSGSLMPQKDS